MERKKLLTQDEIKEVNERLEGRMKSFDKEVNEKSKKSEDLTTIEIKIEENIDSSNEKYDSDGC